MLMLDQLDGRVPAIVKKPEIQMQFRQDQKLCVDQTMLRASATCQEIVRQLQVIQRRQPVPRCRQGSCTERRVKPHTSCLMLSMAS